jgi:hypothetical protein
VFPYVSHQNHIGIIFAAFFFVFEYFCIVDLLLVTFHVSLVTFGLIGV